LACDNAGLEQLRQHARTVKHKNLVMELTSQSTLKAVPSSSPSAIRTTEKQLTEQLPTAKPKKVQLYVKADAVLKAEILWCLQIVKSNFSFRSVDSSTNTFAAMFQDSQIAKDLHLGRTKASYMIADGLHPYFAEELIREVNGSSSMMVLHYDETTQVQIKKQLNMHIRYWSESRNEVCVRFYKALMFGHAEGKLVSERIMAA
jgi:hypothetical protein